MTDSEPVPHRRGRGHKVPGARDAILRAAREQFATHGFERTTIRSVAKAADVDPRLVMHFYTNKEDLFTAALALPEGVVERLQAAFDAPADQVPERLVRAYVDLWESSKTAAQVRATLRSAATSPVAADLLRQTMVRRIPTEVADRWSPAVLVTAVSVLLGSSLTRYVVGVPALAEMSRDEYVAALVPPVTACLAAEPGPDDEPGRTAP